MKFVLALLAALAFCAPAQAQKVYSQAELDGLLAPIALQPDGVVSQVLIAATYPADVAAAAAWSRANPQLRGDAAVRAVEQEPWDPSVKSLVAFPELLARMDESPQWLDDLGQAFLAQEPQVMDTVQGLRRRAQANGQLSSSGQTVVYQQGEAIYVQPRTEVVYVRYYDPYVVYGPWWWGPYYHPIVWRPWNPYPVVVFRGFFYTAPDWHHHHVKVIHRPVYASPHYPHVAPGKWQRQSPQQHRAHSQTVKPYVRVPESQRKPIVQSQQQMPAANGWSQNAQRRDVTRAPQHQQPSQQAHQMPQRQGQPQQHQQREHRAIEPRRQSDNASRGREHRGADNRGRGGEQRGRGGEQRGRGGEQRSHRG